MCGCVCGCAHTRARGASGRCVSVVTDARGRESSRTPRQRHRATQIYILTLTYRRSVWVRGCSARVSAWCDTREGGGTDALVRRGRVNKQAPGRCARPAEHLTVTVVVCVSDLVRSGGGDLDGVPFDGLVLRRRSPILGAKLRVSPKMVGDVDSFGSCAHSTIAILHTSTTDQTTTSEQHQGTQAEHSPLRLSSSATTRSCLAGTLDQARPARYSKRTLPRARRRSVQCLPGCEGCASPR